MENPRPTSTIAVHQGDDVRTKLARIKADHGRCLTQTEIATRLILRADADAIERALSGELEESTVAA